MTRQARPFALGTITLAAWLAWAPAHAVSFTVTDLGTLGGDLTVARALNNVGQVVGGTAAGASWIWSADTGMSQIAFYTSSSASGINDAGQVVGTASIIALPGFAYLWTQADGARPLNLDAYTSTANGINASGQITGSRQALVSSQTTGYVTDPGGAWRGRTGWANAINDGGQAAGYSAGGFTHATLWASDGSRQDIHTTGRSSYASALNNEGQVVGMNYDDDGKGKTFLWRADTGMQLLGTLARDSRATGINDAGQVVGWADANSTGAPVGAFLWTAREGMLDINALRSAGSTARVTYAAAINQLGQIVGQDENRHAVLLTPTGELAWRASSGGSFSDGRNWELGFAPNKFLDAQVYTTGAQLITLGRDTTVNSLGLGGATGGRPTLALQDGATLSAAYGVTVRATGMLTGDGRVAGAVVNQGTVLASNLRIDGTLSNQGLVITQAGAPGRLATDLDNQASGQLRVGSAEVMVLSGASHRNSGRIEVRGGELEVSGTLTNEAGGRVLVGGGTLRFNDGLANRGEVNIGFNGAELFGGVVQGAGGRLVLSGRSNSTFYDAVDIGAASELRVSADATALFFGTVQQRSGALFTGTGTKFYEGGLSVGASPGLGTDEGSIVFGGSSLYLAEIGGTTAGSGFDKLLVAGDLRFGGTLKLVSWAGFAAQAGQRFDLFDWGSAGGSFSSIDASGLALADGLMLDTSRLYVDGSVAVASVPEPASWALALGGLLVVARVARRRS